MLPPSPMLATKKRVCRHAFILIAMALMICGCTPAGPRALLKGKEYFDQREFTEAATEFKIATTLLATNASAWNYYGVTLQKLGQPTEAAEAYQQALSCNRDLMEAHYNLGCLWLEQNKPDAAKAEFTVYTLRRPNQLDGWLKLGSTQLRTGELQPAERSFSSAYYLNTNSPEALNGLGLARVQRGRPREASQFFAAAIAKRPDFGAAYLNLATVAQEYLHDNELAVKNYRAYLQVTPQAGNSADINALISDLEQTVPVIADLTTPEPPLGTPSSPPARATARTAPEPNSHPSATARNSTATKPESVSTPTVASATEVGTPPLQDVSVMPEPVIVANPSPPPVTPAPAQPGDFDSDSTAKKKPGLLQKISPSHWFGGGKKKDEANGVTPLPSGGQEDVLAETGPSPAPAPDKSVPAVVYVTPSGLAAAPPKVNQPLVVNFPRYSYLSPAKPPGGKRTAAEAAFAKAWNFEQSERLRDALQWYLQSAQYDPSWYNAQYNTAILSYRLKSYRQALKSFEMALAIQPDSADARYSFAITLKNAGYVLDAVNELNKVAAAKPADARVQLALGNIYAQQIHDVARARTHYKKFLELEPDNSQATDIRFWLAGNPQ
jgi:tetratricopeptide (TPR) repeat protein